MAKTDNKHFYRISNLQTQQGLWYDLEGEFTGLIHDKFNFCANHKLKMDFDPDVVGYLSAAGSLEVLYKWFTKEDIKKLQEHGYYLTVYECPNYKFYDKFQHWLINQSDARLVEQIVL